MHPMPSELARALADARAGDVRRGVDQPRPPSGPGEPGVAGHHRAASPSSAVGPARYEGPSPVRPGSGGAREAAGWWLVSMGLRLALPRAERAALSAAGR